MAPPDLKEYKTKAAFFDTQVDAAWSAGEYQQEEQEKLERLWQAVGDLQGKHILEPGCGTGRLTELLSEKAGPDGRVVALDISSGMIAKARKRLSSRKNVFLIEECLENISEAPDSFDLVIHHQVLPHYLDQALALEISSRLLKPEGQLLVIHFINSLQINDIHRKAGTVVENDRLPEEQDLRTMLADTGFSLLDLNDDAGGFFLSAKRSKKGNHGQQ